MKLRTLLAATLLLNACANQATTYDEIEAEAKRTGDDRRLRQFERDAERAEQFFRLRQQCMESTGHVWICTGSTLRGERRRKATTLEEQVRVYRTDKMRCGCTENRLR